MSGLDQYPAMRLHVSGPASAPENRYSRHAHDQKPGPAARIDSANREELRIPDQPPCLAKSST